MTAGRRAAILAVAITAAAFLTRPSPVAACVGGMDFGWAVAQARGGIAQGRVVDAVDTMGSGVRVRLDGVTRVSGRPPIAAWVSLSMGDVCDQSADSGDTLWLLYDVESLVVTKGLAIAFVVEGPDAVSREEVAAALAALPETDTVVRPSEPPSHGAILGLLGLLLLTFLVYARRLDRMIRR